MFALGDVIRFYSIEAGKNKYHLCISLDGHYIFLNSPKQRIYPGDLIVPCKEFPFLPPTPSGDSVISCTIVMKKSNADLAEHGARKLGSVSIDLLRRVVRFVESSPVLTDEEKETFLNAAGDWL